MSVHDIASRRVGAVSAELGTGADRARVRLTIGPRDDLGVVLHAVSCAAPGDRPGRTVYRHIRWPEPIMEEV